MKTITKVFLALALFLILSGGLLAASGWAMGADTTLETSLNGYPVRLHFMGISSVGTDFDDWERAGEHSSANLISGANTAGGRNLEPLREIDIEVNAAEIVFRQAQDYGVELTWDRDDLAMDFEVNNGILTVWSTQDHVRNLKNRKATVMVYLPEAAALDLLEISVDMGSAKLEGLTVDDLDISVDMGSAKLTDVSARSAELSSDMGDVIARGLTVTNTLSAECSMGNIDISGDVSGSVDLDCDMGAMTFHTTASASDFGYNLAVDMGSIRVDGKTYHNTAERSGGSSYLEAECSMGDIDIKFGA